MAKTRTRNTAAPAAAPARTARAKSKKPAGTELEVLEEEGGGNIDTGIVIMTTVLLVTAFFLFDQMRGMYGEGLFL